MNVTWGLLTALSLVCHTESKCSPTSYYKNCWIRRFPGVFIDIEESQRRGAQLLKSYQEETALTCSRTCCLTRNFSCNLAIFHYDTSQENANCFHLHCPTLESCILSHRRNVVLYNITKGVDPDLLVFGKSFTSNVRVLPHHYSRVNASEPLPSDKRQFLHPPPPAVLPPTSAAPVKSPVTGSTSSTALQDSSQPTTNPATTAALSSTGVFAQTETPATSGTSPTPSFNTPLSSTTVSPDSGRTSPAFSATTAQPPTSTPAHHSSTTFSQSDSSPPTSSKAGDRYPTHTSGVPELGWHVATHSLLVAVAVCVTVLLSCCCSILLVASWRGQRKRMGRYRTSWRGKTGSMRLIKYVLVRENS